MLQNNKNSYIFQAILVIACICSFGFLSMADDMVLSLGKSLQIAANNNLNIKKADEAVRYSEYGKKDAFTLFLPKVSSSASFTRLGQASTYEINSVSVQATKKNLYDVKVTLTQPVFTGGQIQYTYRSAEKDINRSEHARETLIQNISFNVKQTYFSALQAEKNVSVACELKQQAQQHLSIAKKMFASGLVTKIDVLKTGVFLLESESTITQTENAVSLAKANLNYLLNRPLETKIVLDDILAMKKQHCPLSQWKTAALENRPELKEILSGLGMSEDSIEIARSNYFPQLYFMSNFQDEKGTQASLSKWKPSWNVMLTCAIDVWNWRSTKYKIKQAQSIRSQMKNDYELLQKTIELEVEKAYLDLESASKRITTASKTIDEAAENLRMTDLLYQEGLSTTTDVLDAQTSLSKAKNDYHQALYDYQISYALLEKAAGTR